jgi:acid phosphatase type 7
MNAPNFLRRMIGAFPFARRGLRRHGRRTSAGVLVAGAFWLSTSSCVDRPVEPPPPLPIAELQISASVGGTMVSTLVVTVSAPDIQPPLVYNITVVNETAVDNIAIPVGSDRLVLVRAVDVAGVTTHEGSREVDVREGTNPAVSITLFPLIGDQPIDVRLGNREIRITPGVGLMVPGGTITLSAVVTDLAGTPVPVDPTEIRWASLNTRIATVDAQGKVNGESFGNVHIVASYGGAAGMARVSVGPATGELIVAAGDIGECIAPAIRQPKPAAVATAALLDGLQGTVLALGDNAYPSGRIQDYTDCYAPTWGRHKARTRPVPGNHEYEATSNGGYFTYFNDVLAPFGAAATDPNRGWYSFDVGTGSARWHIIALNSEVAHNPTAAQVTWLKADLDATTAKCVLAYWHQPFFSSGDHHGNDASYRPFWDTLYAKNADVIVVGHEHLYERFGPQTPVAQLDPARGIRQFTVGTGGTDLYAFAPALRGNSEFGSVQHGVLQLLLADNSYSWRFIGIDGVVRDVGYGACH